jgi:hypothetical protein
MTMPDPTLAVICLLALYVIVSLAWLIAAWRKEHRHD